MTAMIAIGLYFSMINGATITAFAWDKHCARNGYWRVPEKTLLTMAFIGGTLGAVAAQHGFRHKTRKEPFRTILYMIAGLHLTAVSIIMIPSVRDALWSQANWWPETFKDAHVSNRPCNIRVYDAKRLDPTEKGFVSTPQPAAEFL